VRLVTGEPVFRPILWLIRDGGEWACMDLIVGLFLFL